MSLLAFEVPFPVVTLGAILGLTYGLLAVGMVLVYRSSRLVNFAHGEVGAFAAVVLGALVHHRGWPYYAALPFALGVGAAIGVAIEVLVVRRLANAPRLMGIVATLGVGQVLVVASILLDAEAGSGGTYPSPPGLPTFHLGDLRITQAYSGMLIAAPLVVLGIALFLARSRAGVALRAAAANPDAARLAAIPAGRMSALAWGLAGGLSALTAILVFPSRGFVTGESFGPGLLLRALTAGVIARMNSLPRAFAAAIGLGVIEQVLLWNTSQSGLVEVVLFGLILVALSLQGPLGARREDKGSWAAVSAASPLAPEVKRLPLVKWTPRAASLLGVGVIASLPLFLSNEHSATLIGILGFATIGLSVSLVTGLGGQLTLGQFAIAAIGATVSYVITSHVGAFPIAFAYAGLAGAAVGIALGLPALRSRGLLLTVSTLSFAVVVPAWLITRTWMLGSGTNPGRPVIGDSPISTARGYYVVVFVVFLVALGLCMNVRRSGLARLMLAVRDNEDNARAFGVSTRRIQIQGLGLAGFIAGIGGAAYGHAFASIGPTTFPVAANIDIVVMTVLGGVTSTVGPLIGVVFVVGIPAFVKLDAAGLAASKLGALLVILAFPGGIVRAFEPLRDRLIKRFVKIPDARLRPALTRPVMQTREKSIEGVVLEATRIRKTFGGVSAVEEVSLSVEAREILGLIGPNGAGKTTTFELLSGFTLPDAGHVTYLGHDITHQSPDGRARAGLVRSFQDAALFPTLTVHDALVVSLGVADPTPFAHAVLGTRAAEKRRSAKADEFVDRFNLGDYRDRRIQELSTGTRRITELACLVAREPTLLLLDEPASGVAQREIEALGGVLKSLRDELGLTLIVIEHDIPLIMEISDRVVAMENGRVIASGPPAEVRTNHQVAAAYLGGDVLAIERSGKALQKTR